MKNYIYLLTVILLTACGGASTSSSNHADYEKTITDNLLKGSDTKENTGFKIIELSEHGTITVADSIAYLKKGKNLTPDNLQAYEGRNASDVLVKIVRCKYSILSIEETFDFYLSPDGSRCYAKTRAK